MNKARTLQVTDYIVPLWGAEFVDGPRWVGNPNCKRINLQIIFASLCTSGDERRRRDELHRYIVDSICCEYTKGRKHSNSKKKKVFTYAHTYLRIIIVCYLRCCHNLILFKLFSTWIHATNIWNINFMSFNYFLSFCSFVFRFTFLPITICLHKHFVRGTYITTTIRTVVLW